MAGPFGGGEGTAGFFDATLEVVEAVVEGVEAAGARGAVALLLVRFELRSCRRLLLCDGCALVSVAALDIGRERVVLALEWPPLPLSMLWHTGGA